jgi:hypothetical protein
MARAAWVETVMTSPNKDVLAVQTLRNSIMGATFLSSTAVLLIVGTLTLSGQGDKLSETWHALNLFGATYGGVWQTKLLVLLLDMFVAFFSFAQAIRLYHHVGYMINVPTTMAHRALVAPARRAAPEPRRVFLCDRHARVLRVGAARVLAVRPASHAAVDAGSDSDTLSPGPCAKSAGGRLSVAAGRNRALNDRRPNEKPKPGRRDAPCHALLHRQARVVGRYHRCRVRGGEIQYRPGRV